jgi:hypothetical protein
MEHIYALAHYIDGKKIYFYVGRSTREPLIRFREHQANVNSVSHQEDVYEYIRKSVQCAIFEQEILCYCEDDNENDYEDFYVIKLIQEGHILQNMKKGDAKRIALGNEAAMLKSSGVELRSPRELHVYRASQKSEALRLKVLADGQMPSPKGPILNEFFKQHNAQLAVKKEKDRANEVKSTVSKNRRDAEYAAWLFEQRRLFDAGDE